MNTFLDAAIDHPYFWPVFVILWFLVSLAIGPLLSGFDKRSHQ